MLMIEKCELHQKNIDSLCKEALDPGFQEGKQGSFTSFNAADRENEVREGCPQWECYSKSGMSQEKNEILKEGIKEDRKLEWIHQSLNLQDT